jgi:diguanylate cyclase (GGDEF)-like protein/PAS domain S-box-containing protein
VFESRPTRVLLVEDNPGDARLLRVMLEEAGGERFALRHAGTLADGLAQLRTEPADVMLLDLSLPDSHGIETLRHAAAQAPGVSIILITGADDETVASAAVQAGAQDYLVKGQIDSNLLARAIRYAFERTRADEALRESEERYALAVEGARDGLWDWNLRTNEMYFSARWKAMLGHAEHEIGSRPEEWLSRVHPDDRERVQTATGRHVDGSTEYFEDEHRILQKDGGYRWVLSRGLAVRDGEGRATRMAGSLTDITERKSSEAQLLHTALHDSLTGLSNRALFTERLDHAISRVKRRHDLRFAVLFLDLDRFKVLNDSMGHVTGDELLIAIGQRLRALLRPTDLIARLGGDEFAILLEDLHSESEAVEVSERILGDLKRPFRLQGHEAFTTASIGIAPSAPSYDRAEEWVRDADTAMYRAKSLGKARHVVFDTAMHVHAVALLQMETDLRKALETQEFHLHYQPIVALDSGRIVGFEALARWQHAKRGAIAPVEFIPVAEETGLIVPMGWWAVREACRQMRVWHRHFPAAQPLTVSVNLSVKQFSQPDLVEQIQRILRETGCPADALKVEITESAIMEHAGFATTMLASLREVGVQLSIDDFGTGYSSLSYLPRLPIDTLKIDRAFISQMDADDENAEIARTIVTLARNLKMNVVAEGVETVEQLRQLRALQCQYGQGWLFSPPLDADGAAALIGAACPLRQAV